MKKKKQKHIATWAGIIALGLILVIIASVMLYRMMVCNATSRDGEAHGYHIYPGTTLDSIMNMLEADYDIASRSNVLLYAQHADMTVAKAGYYRFDKRISSRVLVNWLKMGYQVPISLTFGTEIHDRQQLAGRLGHVLLLDSADVMARLDSVEYLKQFGLKCETAVCLFIPDTYEMYWTISPDELFARMHREYKVYWNEDRLAKAKAIKLTPTEVSTLASIVLAETPKAKEHATIASLYLNRLKKGMPLQACPTVIFATGNYSMHRVMRSHLQMDSPYNTYKNRGLPPGPIRLAGAAVMDSVLNAPKTDYLYMCANPDWTFTHVFSSTYAHHQRVAQAYRRELNKRGIK